MFEGRRRPWLIPKAKEVVLAANLFVLWFLKWRLGNPTMTEDVGSLDIWIECVDEGCRWPGLRVDETTRTTRRIEMRKGGGVENGWWLVCWLLKAIRINEKRDDKDDGDGDRSNDEDEDIDDNDESDGEEIEREREVGRPITFTIRQNKRQASRSPNDGA